MTGMRAKAAGLQDWSRVSLLVGAVLLLASGYSLFADSRDPTVRQSNLDRVVTDLEQRVRDDPQNAEARLAVALAYGERGLHREAIAQFEQSLVLAPDAPAALIGLARSRYALGETAKAREAYQRVADLNAENPRRYTIEQLGGVYYELGRIAMDQGDAATARGWLSEALQVNRTDADALRLLGLAHVRLGDNAEAERALFGAVRLVPDYREVYEALASMYEKAGDRPRASYARGMLKLADRAPQEALPLIESAASALPDVPQVHEGLGIAYEAVGRPQDALTAYRRAVSLDPNIFLSDLALDRLASAGAGG